MSKTSTTLLALTGVLAAASGTLSAEAAQPGAETRSQHDARMAWWRASRFGMFVHWGLYAVPAGMWHGKRVPGRAVNTQGYSEWLMDNAMIPVSEYAKLAPQFNPVKFDADAWAQTARDAGMKYLIFTAKHHDGFAMFHSQASRFNIVDATPFQRDPVAELAAACRKRGIKFGLYYSQSQDWSHPGGAAWDGHWDKAQDGDYDDYLQKIAVPQVKELLTKYGPISVFWFDTDADMTPKRAAPFVEALKRQPNIIYNDRLGGGVRGDTDTPEQRIPATGLKDRDWESCMTINDTWGYRSDDKNYKSSEDLLRNLIDIASKGGNYLLNVGPDASGVIPDPEKERLKAIGSWLKVNGDSIYGTTASPFKRLPFDGRATVRGSRLYLNVFHWPAAGLTLAGLQTSVVSAQVLATHRTLAVTKDADGTLRLSKPDALDPVSTVLVLQLSGPPVVTEIVPTLTPQPDGRLVLSASDAVLDGDTIALDGSGDNADLGYWTDAKDSAHWQVSIPTPGTYRVELDYSCEPGSEGSTFALQADGAVTPITGTVAKTASWGDYQTITLGETLTLPAGKHLLRIVPLTKPGLAVMNLRRLVLIPTL